MQQEESKDEPEQELCALGAGCPFRDDEDHALECAHPVVKHAAVDYPAVSFQQSLYNRAYSHARAPATTPQLFRAVRELVKAHCEKHDIPLERGEDFHDELMSDVFGALEGVDGVEELQNHIDFVMQRLWTSAIQMNGVPPVQRREFCSLLNEALREMAPPKRVIPAMQLARALNLMCVVRRSVGAVGFPAAAETYRGGALPQQYERFFYVGQKYRVPQFLPTSCSVNVAQDFMRLVRDEPVVKWTVQLDPRGEHDVRHRCMQVNLVQKRGQSVQQESEYLFAPYSVFTVVAVRWSPNPTRVTPHEITITPALDNLEEPDYLPMAPWC